MASDNFSWKDSEKELVAEQSGLGSSLIGFMLALFIGLAVRALVAPEKVQVHIQKAISHVHPDLHITFEEAFVSFAHGAMPDLSVVVRGGVVSSEKKCWMSPTMEIHELRLPLSWSHLLRGEIYIHEVLIDTVDLSLRNAPESCENPRESAAAGINDSQQVLQREPAQFNAKSGKNESESFKNVSRKNPIDMLKIESLRVHYLPIAFTSAQINQFKLHLKSPEPRWVEITGQLSLGGDMLAGDFGSYADLKVNAIDGESASISASAKGVLREGHYQIAVTAKPKSDEFSLDLDVQHVPISQIIPLLKKYRLMNSDISGRQAWISGNAAMSGVIAQAKATPINFQNIRLEGDLGEFSLSHASVKSVEPLVYSPMEFQIKALNIKNFLEFLGKPHPSTIFSDLGSFSGTAIFNNPEDLRLRGDYSGLEFIFSNRGSRQIQKMELISGELLLKKGQWNITLDRIKPNDGIFDGQISVKADRDFRSIAVDSKINELSLSPQVQVLMTGGGSLGSANGRLQTSFDHDSLKSIQGQLKWDQILVDGIRLYRPKVQISTKEDLFLMDLNAQEFEIQRDIPSIGNLFDPVYQGIDESFKNRNSLSAKGLSVKIETKKLRELNWKNLRLNTPAGLLISNGGWSEKGDLAGDITLPQRHLKWSLSGSRAKPLVVGGRRE